MKTKFLIGAVMIFVSGAPLLADHYHWYEWRESTPEDLFRDQEVSVDLFGTISVGQETARNLSGDRVRDDGRLGAGAGLNYFFIRNLGIGVDAYSESTADSFVDKTSASLIFRIPFEPVHLAPYVFGGGGRQFDPQHLWFGQAGAGLDIRVTHNWGIFADARYMWLGENAKDVGLGRLGLRFAF